MKRLAPWVLFVLALAVILHIGFLHYLPNYLTTRAVNIIYARFGGSGDWTVNTLGYGPLRRAGTDTVVRDNPDTVTSFAVLDVSSTPVRVHCVVPPGGNYWSVSLFAWNTDTFYVVNDLDAPAPEFDLVVIRKDSSYEALPEERVVVSPSQRAVLIVRMNVTNRDDQAEITSLEEYQKAMWVSPVEGVMY